MPASIEGGEWPQSVYLNLKLIFNEDKYAMLERNRAQWKLFKNTITGKISIENHKKPICEKRNSHTKSVHKFQRSSA